METPSAAAPSSGQIWRETTEAESVVLAAAVSGDWEGASELRSQLPGLLARRGCSCGCGSIELKTRQGMPARTVPSPAPCEGIVLGAAGEVVGGLLLWVRDGLLDWLEVYWYDEPLPVPALDRVRWEIVER